MRLVFAGTPATAVPSLTALLDSKHEVAAVVTRPDAPAGRGRRVAASPIALHAMEIGIEVLRPVKPSEPEFLARLAEIAPDCCPVVAYGALIPGKALAIPPHGWVNLHFSILPAWRGAAPVPHAIRHGDEITGATTFSLVAELDAGPVYGVLTEPIRPADTAGDLLERLSESGAELLVATLDGIESGELVARPQPSDGISLAPKLVKSDARVSWKLPALAVDRLIRSCTPAPGAWTTFHGASLKVWPVKLAGGAGRAGGGGGHRGPSGLRAGGDRGGRIQGPGRYRDGAGRAERGPAGRQAPDARRRLGPRGHGQRSPADPRLTRVADMATTTTRPRTDRVRLTAHSVLSAVSSRDAYANLLLASALRDADLHGKDAALATELVYGTLRNRGCYDAVIGLCADRGIEKIDPPVLDALRLGAHQLLGLRIKSHAAVATTVDLVIEVAGRRPSGFANAVLRRIAPRDLESWIQIAAPSRAEDLTGHLSVRYSHPRWIVTAIADALGEQLTDSAEEAGQETEAALAADAGRPIVHLAAAPGLTQAADLVAAGASAAARWSPFGSYLRHGDPGEIAPVAAGRAWVQDEASQLAAYALAQVGDQGVGQGVGQRWLDLCAGPGGKARLLAGLAVQRGATLLAADVHPHRAELVRAAFDRLGAATGTDGIPGAGSVPGAGGAGGAGAGAGGVTGAGIAGGAGAGGVYRCWRRQRCCR